MPPRERQAEPRDKPLIWIASSLGDLRTFPEDARRVAGFELRRVQLGLEPTDWKPMPTVGPGAREVRIQTGVAHRVFYVANFPEAIYVLHAFEKRSRKTAAQDIALGRARYRDVLARRRDHEENK